MDNNQDWIMGGSTFMGIGSPTNEGDQTMGGIPDDGIPFIDDNPVLPPSSFIESLFPENQQPQAPQNPPNVMSPSAFLQPPSQNQQPQAPQNPPNTMSPSTFLQSLPPNQQPQSLGGIPDDGIPFIEDNPVMSPSVFPQPPPQNQSPQSPQNPPNIMSPSAFIQGPSPQGPIFPSVYPPPPDDIPNNPQDPLSPSAYLPPLPSDNPNNPQDPLSPSAYLPPLGSGNPNNPQGPISPSAYLPPLGSGNPNNPQGPPQSPTNPPDDVDIYQMDAVGSQRIRRVNKCSLCSRFPRLSSTWKQCNWFVRGGVQYGCELCWQWGMVCVVGNVALPPYPDPTLQHHRFHNKCRPCKDHKLTCDRQRPCDGCVLHLGNPNGCAEPDRLRGTFRRGDGYATDMYTYLSMLGGGPDGMQSRQKYLEILDMPGDFHVQYASWLAGGALPVPPGYPPPARSPTRPPLRLRTLPDRIPIQQRKPNIALDARGPPRLTASSPFPSRVVTLYAENRDLLGPLVRRRNWLELSDISEAFRGPPSPPPNFTFFNVAQIPDLEERINLPFGVPGRISQCRAHPNEANIPALRAVPSSVQPRTLLISQQCAEQQTREAGSVCTRSARSACVDISHSQNVPVCIHCDEAARRVVVQAIISIAKSIRAYACSECAAAAGPNEFQGRALNVWGLAPNAFDNGGPPNPANSVSRGAPRPVTGCMCATKLANNTLCTPHRLSHFQTVRSTADALRNFVLANFGVMICPFCLLRPGADALDYADHQNNPHQRVAYVCMACLGIVTTDAATHESLDAIGAI